MKGLSTCRETLTGSQRKDARCWGPESDRACVSEKLEGELRRREQTSMESFKSTWRAIRFLSIEIGRKGRACGFSFRGHTGIVFSLDLFLITEVGVIMGDKAF